MSAEDRAKALRGLLDKQDSYVAALRAENAAIAAGHGDLQRRAELIERMAKAAERIGNPPKPSTTSSTPPAKSRFEDRDRPRAPAGETPDEKAERERLAAVEGSLSFRGAFLETVGMTEQHIEDIDKVGKAWETAAAVGVGTYVNTAMDALELVGAGQMKVGKAFGQAIKAGLVAAARTEAQFWLTKALAAKGMGLLGHLGAFAAAALFSAAAGAFSRLGGGGGEGGGAGGGSGGGGGLGSIPGRDSARGDSVLTIHMPGGMNVFDSSNPVMVREWKKMFEDLTGRRVILTVGR